MEWKKSKIDLLGVLELDSEEEREAVFKGPKNKFPTINGRCKPSVKNFNEFWAGWIKINPTYTHSSGITKI